MKCCGAMCSASRAKTGAIELCLVRQPEYEGRAHIRPRQSRHGSRMTHTDTDKSRWSPREAFHQVTQVCAQIVGSEWSFIVAVALIAGWPVGGPFFGFSDTWQLIISTARR